jgi:signal peptidase I
MDSIAYDEPGGVSGGSEVSDLAVELEVKVPDAGGTLVLELVKKGRPFACQLNLSDGSAQMLFPGLKPEAQPRAKEGVISRAGSYHLLFANIDHELTLLVDNKRVHFDKPTTYAELTEANGGPQRTASSPVGIGVGGSAVKASHLRVWRDVYYTYDDSRRTLSHPRYAAMSDVPSRWPEASDWACTPASAVTRLREAGADVRPGDQYFFVGQENDGRGPSRDGVASEDQYLPLGDNSPSSQDGRYWGNRHFVDRRLLVGKALYIYWPHSFDKIRFSDSFSIPLPFFPNFGRMGFVR